MSASAAFTLSHHLGRTASQRTAEVRKQVMNALLTTNRDLTTLEVAEVAQCDKYQALIALRYFEEHKNVFRRGYRKDTSGPGQPAVVWTLEEPKYDFEGSSHEQHQRSRTNSGPACRHP